MSYIQHILIVCCKDGVNYSDSINNVIKIPYVHRIEMECYTIALYWCALIKSPKILGTFFLRFLFYSFIFWNHLLCLDCVFPVSNSFVPNQTVSLHVLVRCIVYLCINVLMHICIMNYERPSLNSL